MDWRHLIWRGLRRHRSRGRHGYNRAFHFRCELRRAEWGGRWSSLWLSLRRVRGLAPCQSGVWRAPAQLACNANGCYERLQDGLVIQTGFVTSSVSGFTSWTYPVPFGSGLMAVSATIASRTDVSAPYIAQVGAGTRDQIPFRATDVNGNNVVYGVSLIAIGY